MKTITVTELRRDLSAVLVDVEAGEAYVVTKHRRLIARLVPPVDENANPALQQVTPPRRSGPTSLWSMTPWKLQTAASVDELLATMQSAW